MYSFDLAYYIKMSVKYSKFDTAEDLPKLKLDAIDLVLNENNIFKLKTVLDFLKPLEIISLNTAGWVCTNSTEGYIDRLFAMCEYLKKINPSIICLQEVVPAQGETEKLLDLKFPDYQIIFPRYYDREKNTKAMLCVLLVKKTIIRNENQIEIKALHNLEDNLRYNYVTFPSVYGRELAVLNLHVPMIPPTGGEDYISSREAMRAEFVKAVENAANYCDIIAGDFNMKENSYLISKLKKMTVRTAVIDHIAFKADIGIVDHLEINEDLAKRQMTDHPAVHGRISIT